MPLRTDRSVPHVILFSQKHKVAAVFEAQWPGKVRGIQSSNATFNLQSLDVRNFDTSKEKPHCSQSSCILAQDVLYVPPFSLKTP